ncbi:tyrosine-type recombinase/integrase [Altericroceibacterium endophyticum]|uniref:Integrase arm-type DNA-binding domain-containing protein n=1 Tax=Altericroceibacterium endophyticum TaxID=1808508 RepID=A0A6I4T8U1_9SPHN|nr:integrase arm-type DNA-binding domain-containing protein [Altericroceibacterium endophyticum]MXO66280.1 integrase arm-type DNA-binding domain-containing protein [Altericroceibacterium endophyticum]
MGRLSDAKVRAAKARDKAYKLSDGEQLYLFVTAKRARSWRMNYKFGRNAQGKPLQKTLTIGSYPAISLKDAREARDVAKSMLARGLEPSPTDLFSRANADEDLRPSFRKVALEWLDGQKPRWSAVHLSDVKASLENEIYPAIGEMRLADIDAPCVLRLLRSVADRGAIETAHRLRQRISAVFVYGIALGYVSADPAAGLRAILPPKPKTKSQPAITHLDQLRQLLVDCEAERCRVQTKLALRLIALTAVRPGELHGARWHEFEDLDGPEPLWRIPAARMKGDMGRKQETDGDHLVPLAPQSVEVIRAIEPLTGHFPLVFPSERHGHRPMSENTLRALLIRAGYYQRHVPHGFRSAFSTIMNERANDLGRPNDRAVIDLMLAHVPTNKVERAYNRAAYMTRRRELAGEWADLLLKDMWPVAVHMGQPIRWASNGPGRFNP